jgi:hypothetical protein
LFFQIPHTQGHRLLCSGSLHGNRMRPFRLQFFSLLSEIKRILICFTCVSLFHYKISLLFFRFKFFASLRFSNFRFEAKQSEIQVYYFAFFVALKFSLRFDLVVFASKQNEGENFFASKEAKFNIFRIISLPNFVSGEKKTIFVSLQFFRLIFAYFTFVFSTDFWCFASK